MVLMCGTRYDSSAMVRIFGKKSKVRLVDGGEVELRRCPRCDHTGEFRECTIDKTYTAYIVVDLWSSQSKAFRCTRCHEAMPLEETREPELSPRQRAKLGKERAKEAKRQAAAAEVERKRAEREAAAARKRAEREAAAKEGALDDELAAMKARLGLD